LGELGHGLEGRRLGALYAANPGRLGVRPASGSFSPPPGVVKWTARLGSGAGDGPLHERVAGQVGVAVREPAEGGRAHAGHRAVRPPALRRRATAPRAPPRTQTATARRAAGARAAATGRGQGGGGGGRAPRRPSSAGQAWRRSTGPPQAVSVRTSRGSHGREG